MSEPAVPRPRVYITQPIAKTAVGRLREIAAVTMNPDASRVIAKRALIAAVRRCDILFCLLHDRIDRDVIAANPKLRMIAAMSVTPSHIDMDAANAHGIPVTVVPVLQTETTADLCFGLMIAVARRMVESDRLVRTGRLATCVDDHSPGNTFGEIKSVNNRVHGDTEVIS